MTRRLSFDHTPKMLALRHSGTTDVALFWSKRTHRAAVVVEDDATGEHFELPVKAGDNPLDLYDHPFAYVTASRALQTRSRRPHREISSTVNRHRR